MNLPDRLPQTSPLSERINDLFAYEHYGHRLPIMESSGIPDALVIGQDRNRKSKVLSAHVAVIPLHPEGGVVKGFNPDMLQAMVFVRRYDNNLFAQVFNSLQHHPDAMGEALKHADRGVIAMHGEIYGRDMHTEPGDLYKEIIRFSKTNDPRTASLEFAYMLQTGKWPFDLYVVSVGEQYHSRVDYILSNPFPTMPQEAFPSKELDIDTSIKYSPFPMK